MHTPQQDWNTLLRMEEEYIEKMCAEIVAFHPDIVITEKGVSGACLLRKVVLVLEGGWGGWMDAPVAIQHLRLCTHAITHTFHVK